MSTIILVPWYFHWDLLETRAVLAISQWEFKNACETPSKTLRFYWMVMRFATAPALLSSDTFQRGGSESSQLKSSEIHMIASCRSLCRRGRSAAHISSLSRGWHSSRNNLTCCVLTNCNHLWANLHMFQNSFYIPLLSCKSMPLTVHSPLCK